MAKNKNAHGHSDPSGPAASSAHDEHRPNVKIYIAVFAALMALTGLTVIVSKFHLPRPQAITLGLLIAIVKASLVGALFMHLWGEKKLIHKFLYTTAFFACILVIPMIDFVLLSPRALSHADVAAEHPDEGAKISADVPAPSTDAPAPAPAPVKAAKKKSKAKKS